MGRPSSMHLALLSLVVLHWSLLAEGKRAVMPWGWSSSLSRIASSSKRTAASFILQRGGYQDQEHSSSITEPDQEESLDDKVRRAMEKLGLTPPAAEEETIDASSATTAETTCEGGVCEMPTQPTTEQQQQQDPEALADVISSSMSIDRSLAMAAIVATATMQGDKHLFNEVAARQMILQELQVVSSVPKDSEQVQQLVQQEGISVFEARRALAFADGNMDNARAILLAEKEDLKLNEKEEADTDTEVKENKAAPEAPINFPTVEVKSNFDPTKMAQPEAPQESAAPPQPADKSKVVFEATSKDIQKLVLESPVPVLLDVYADWCGPCKVLGPALEEMAVKSGGAFRLVKVNSDNERPVSGALDVTALPTVFGVKNGRIVNMFQGMPKSQEAMQSFMMGLMVNESHFSPPLTEEQKQQYADLTSKLVKMAGSACFSFSAREGLQDRVTAQLDKLAEQTGDFSIAEESAQVLKSLLLNVIRDPYAPKFRVVKLDNKVIAAKIKQYPACLAFLKNVGFSATSESELVLHKNKPVINVAPLIVARDTIDKWLDASRYEVAKAARKRKDEIDRVRVQKELETARANEPEEEASGEVLVDPDACTIKARIEGKKKIHALDLRADDSLTKVLSKLPVSIPDGEEVKITCAAKRLVVSASDGATMKQSLRQLGLHPAASIVVAIGSERSAPSTSKKSTKSKIADRAAKKKKKGSHTMHSIGVYAKDDNAKGELIDGGGGVMYEHDVSDDEEEKVKDVKPDIDNEENSSEGEGAAAGAVEEE
ncbi:hypothetical protein MPSEU_000220700 [Mayamaea pseudoterrestris]|nr:hypothetical protein MPSEU_000220700 [Mayamaea pseudoterrestris]GKY92504.1 hypothetical protein MPSEU_000220700 [Mayamaea pseudoterrestris]